MMFPTNFNEKFYKVGKVFYMCRFTGGFWFRFFKGYGLHGKNFKIHGLIFSDRYHLKKRLIIGNWIFKILKP